MKTINLLPLLGTFVLVILFASCDKEITYPHVLKYVGIENKGKAQVYVKYGNSTIAQIPNTWVGIAGNAVFTDAGIAAAAGSKITLNSFTSSTFSNGTTSTNVPCTRNSDYLFTFSIGATGAEVPLTGTGDETTMVLHFYSSAKHGHTGAVVASAGIPGTIASLDLTTMAIGDTLVFMNYDQRYTE